ncbi:Gluconate utilization system GNT-I transcriptional repressor [Raoultella terrigena]|uniref:Gluconate utilization system GNT-I transcriptional repressor n=1 Tax=Raoultella terrigena TaxID=577 RepID=A0A4U9D4B5_RAOTE|nr:Gluconate utilization system GNT-I transcriptional repressor [Raoultella terrigena]
MSLTRKRRSTGKVTIADVAQLAGVGTMTVSRALRTPEQVSDKLREKIEAAVQELGYMPNLAASALASASSRTIAMVVPNLAEAGCSAMFAGLQQVLQPAGYQIMLAESQHRLEQEEKLLETLLASNIAAAILLSVEHSDTVRHWLNNASIPVMEMGAMRADPIDMNIGIDNVPPCSSSPKCSSIAAIRISACCAPTRSSGFFSSICRGGTKRCCATICRRIG